MNTPSLVGYGILLLLTIVAVVLVPAVFVSWRRDRRAAAEAEADRKKHRTFIGPTTAILEQCYRDEMRPRGPGLCPVCHMPYGGHHARRHIEAGAPLPEDGP
jgi:hypothetical protein